LLLLVIIHLPLCEHHNRQSRPFSRRSVDRNEVLPMIPSEGELFKKILGTQWRQLHPDIQPGSTRIRRQASRSITVVC
jgi:hypothetical protein